MRLAAATFLLSTALCASAQAQLTPANKAAIDAFYGAFNTKDLSRLDAALSPSWDDLPLAPGQGPGRDGFKPAAQYFFGAFPDLKVVNQQIVAEGEFAVVRSTLSGTLAGEFSHAAPTGKPFSIQVMDMHQFSGGKIVRTWHVEDWLGMLYQTGSWPVSAAK